MLLIEWVNANGYDGNPNAAVSGPKELFALANVLDNSKYVVAWRILDHGPRDFGWADYNGWNKCVAHFTQEHYNQR